MIFFPTSWKFSINMARRFGIWCSYDLSCYLAQPHHSVTQLCNDALFGVCSSGLLVCLVSYVCFPLTECTLLSCDSLFVIRLCLQSLVLTCSRDWVLNDQVGHRHLYDNLFLGKHHLNLHHLIHISPIRVPGISPFDTVRQ